MTPPPREEHNHPGRVNPHLFKRDCSGASAPGDLRDSPSYRGRPHIYASRAPSTQKHGPHVCDPYSYNPSSPARAQFLPSRSEQSLPLQPEPGAHFPAFAVIHEIPDSGMVRHARENANPRSPLGFDPRSPLGFDPRESVNREQAEYLKISINIDKFTRFFDKKTESLTY